MAPKEMDGPQPAQPVSCFKKEVLCGVPGESVVAGAKMVLQGSMGIMEVEMLLPRAWRGTASWLLGYWVLFTKKQTQVSGAVLFLLVKGDKGVGVRKCAIASAI